MSSGGVAIKGWSLYKRYAENKAKKIADAIRNEKMPQD